MRKKMCKVLAWGLTAALTVTSLQFTGIASVSAAQSTGVITVEGSTTGNVSVPDSPCEFTDLNAQEIIQEAGLGWNLGNTLDAWSGDDFRTGETIWQSTETTKSLIKSVHDMGYNTIRIPVTWTANITEDYEVDEAWMSRVQEVVDYAISEDMYVVINVHHDGCYNDAPTPHGWLDIDGTDEEYQAVREKFNGLWSTIANRFKNYDEHLMFASMNEVYDDDNDLGWLPEGGESLVDSTTGELTEKGKLYQRETTRINELNQDFVNVVRKSGANNSKRWLVVQPHNTQIAAVMNENYADYFTMPEDSANRTMLEIHDYDSFTTAQLSETVDGYAKNFAALKAKYVDQGIPVMVGEWGFGGGDSRSIKFEGVAYLLKKYSLIGIVWDNAGSGSYQVIDRQSQAPSDSCVAAMMRGYYNDTDSSQIVKGTTVTPMTSLEVSQTEVALLAGHTAQVTATATAPSDTNDTIVWSTSDSTVATVHNGKIKGKSAGVAVITAKALTGDASAKITVTVKGETLATPSTEISLSQTSVTLEKGQETYLGASVVPAGNNAGLVYSSKDESIANVSCDGRILAKSEGETTITVATTDGLTREVKVTVSGGAVPSEYQMRLAVHIQYNYKNSKNGDSYYGTEYSDNTVTVLGDGTYTVKFDCSTDLSDTAKEAGVTSLNGIGSLYIKDYDVTKKINKKSPEGDGTIHYDSIKVDGTELLDAPTAEQTAMKGGVFDTGNPFNVWDGSVVSDDKITNNTTLSMISFKNMENPTVIEITFTMTGFYTPPTQTVETPETPAEETPAVQTPAAVTSEPAIVASSPAVEIQKGDQVKVSGAKYTVTDPSKKTVEYKAPVSSKKKSVTIPAQVTINGAKYKVTSIAKNAFKNNKKLRSVTIGANVKKIGSGAFAGCSSLKKIVVKTKTLKSIGANAFKGIAKKAVFTVPKAKYKAYKKLLKTKTGFKKSMKIKKK